MSRNIETGRFGEDKARSYLKSLGYMIIESNYRTSYGEIDIIAKQNNDIIFIEVKTRQNYDFGTPSEAVGRKKQEQLRKLAIGFLKKIGRTNAYCRFDVISIVLSTGDIEHIQGAF